jgi:radical SAM protein with 4Fe4S-binding SPASM domain
MSHRRLPVASPHHPAYVVWELTLACDQPCAHCGSRAGKARPSELSTDEALSVVAELAAMGAREVVLIGGEAYLHPGFTAIARALGERGIVATLTTGGRGVDAALAAEIRAAGIGQVSVSVDGLEAAHDAIRRAKGSFASALAALEHLRQAGVPILANTHVNRVNAPDLEALYELLRERGVEAWQLQITAALGRAADRPAMLLQPYDLVALMPRIAALKERALADGLTLLPGNNLGYFGPEETLLRSARPEHGDHFQGCQAGKLVLGIESDGAVKGCPSLQTSAYVGGNLRSRALASIWAEAPELAFTRARTVESLSGFCRTCPFAEPCMGGCTFTAHALFGKPGDNPYCHYRARTLAREGLRERLVPREAAPGEPFDHGLFELVREPWGAPEPELEHGGDATRATRPPRRRLPLTRP